MSVTWLDDRLAGRAYVATERFSLADLLAVRAPARAGHRPRDADGPAQEPG